jgi:hypothetical protein
MLQQAQITPQTHDRYQRVGLAASGRRLRHRSFVFIQCSQSDDAQRHLIISTAWQHMVLKCTLVAGPVARSSTRPRGAARPPMPGAAGAAADDAAGPRARYRAASRAAPSARGRDRAASCCRWGLHGKNAGSSGWYDTGRPHDFSKQMPAHSGNGGCRAVPLCQAIFVLQLLPHGFTAAADHIPQGRNGGLGCVARRPQRCSVSWQPAQQRRQFAFAQLGSAWEHIRSGQAACNATPYLTPSWSAVVHTFMISW